MNNAFLANFVEEPLGEFSLRAFRTAAGIVIRLRSASVDVNVLIPDRMHYFTGLAAEDVCDPVKLAGPPDTR